MDHSELWGAPRVTRPMIQSEGLPPLLRFLYREELLLSNGGVEQKIIIIMIIMENAFTPRLTSKERARQ